LRQNRQMPADRPPLRLPALAAAARRRAGHRRHFDTRPPVRTPSDTMSCVRGGKLSEPVGCVRRRRPRGSRRGGPSIVGSAGVVALADDRRRKLQSNPSKLASNAFAARPNDGRQRVPAERQHGAGGNRTKQNRADHRTGGSSHRPPDPAGQPGTVGTNDLDQPVRIHTTICQAGLFGDGQGPAARTDHLRPSRWSFLARSVEAVSRSSDDTSKVQFPWHRREAEDGPAAVENLRWAADRSRRNRLSHPFAATPGIDVLWTPMDRPGSPIPRAIRRAHRRPLRPMRRSRS